MKSIVMCQPHNRLIDYRAAEAFSKEAGELAHHYDVLMVRPCSSLLAYAFNAGFAVALNRNAAWFIMLHSDVEPSEGWAGQLIADADEAGADVIHAPVCLKDFSGCTSTAVVYERDVWAQRKRLTLKELAKLPEVFTVEDVREHIDPLAELLLPNTGCHAIRMGDWCRDWCYTVLDQLRQVGGKYEARNLPEDWKLGFDAAERGLKVAGTRRVIAKHHGMCSYSTGKPYGQEQDGQFEEWRRTHLTPAAAGG